VKLKKPSLPGRWYCGPPICALAAVALLLMMSGPALATSVLVSPGADLPAGQTRIHPDTSLGLLGTYEFNVFTDDSLPSEWIFGDSLASAFSNVSVAGTLYSEVYTHSTDGHTLFMYQLANTGIEPLRSGNIAGFSAGWQWLDCGIIHLDGDEDFVQGDVLTLARPGGGGTPQFAFSFQTSSASGPMIYDYVLTSGQTSSWFYAVTDAPSWQVGPATVQDGGSSFSPIPALIPVPEPVTLAGLMLGVGCLGRYVRKRSRM